MFRLIPPLKDYIWGGYKLKTLFGRDNGGKKISESWEVSVHPDGLSRIEGDGTLAQFLQEHPTAVDAQGSPFPVLVKFIDAAQNLSVQVHPDDAYARKYENDNGKTEMWYVVHADEGAGILCGFRKDTAKEEFAAKVADGTVEELLNFIPVKEGDCFLIRAGTVHAIGAGCVICEVQQSSNVTYRVYDYNRVGADGKPRQLHLEKALNVIRFSKFSDTTNSGAFRKVQGGRIRLLTACEYFCCHELLLEGTYQDKNDNSFTAATVLSGEGRADGKPFRPGDSFFIPRGEPFSFEGNAKIILTQKP